MTFFGAAIGDFVKTAIGCKLYTGNLVGVCSTLYGTVVKNVPPFVNYAAQFGDVTEMSVDAMIAAQKRMFAPSRRANRRGR